MDSCFFLLLDDLVPHLFYLLDKRFIQRPTVPERAEEQFIGLFRVANLEQDKSGRPACENQ